MLNTQRYLMGFAAAAQTTSHFVAKGYGPGAMFRNEVDQTLTCAYWSDWDRGYADGKLASVGL